MSRSDVSGGGRATHKVPHNLQSVAMAPSLAEAAAMHTNGIRSAIPRQQRGLDP